MPTTVDFGEAKHLVLRAMWQLAHDTRESHVLDVLGMGLATGANTDGAQTFRCKAVAHVSNTPFKDRACEGLLGPC